MPLTWLLVTTRTFHYFRALDAKLWRGVDTLRATPFALVLLFWFGYLYTPAWLIAGGQTLEYRTALPLGHRAHSWKELKELRAVKEQRLMFGWWGAWPGVVWRFGDGTRYQAFLSEKVSGRELTLAVKWSTRCSGVRVERRKRDD